jgi:hypothetical protein
LADHAGDCLKLGEAASALGHVVGLKRGRGAVGSDLDPRSPAVNFDLRTSADRSVFASRPGRCRVTEAACSSSV